LNDQNTALVTVVGDRNPTDSFLLHVRDSRVRFFWEVADVVDPVRYAAHPALSTLPPPPVPGPAIIGTDSEDDQADDIPVDPDETRPSEHGNQSHITSRLQGNGWRHKSIDFFLQSGLFLSTFQIIGKSTEFIERFDAIPDVPTLRIPLFYLTAGGESISPTPLFRRFFALLGEKTADCTPQLHLGLITFEFHRSLVSESKSQIGIIFSESSLRLNLRHRSLPRCGLLFCITPFDAKLYVIHCQCRNPSFWCSVLHERIINREGLLWTIAMAVFQYIALFDRDLLFTTDDARLQFLSEIPRSPVTPFDIIEAVAGLDG
jgi:hypothetical protein